MESALLFKRLVANLIGDQRLGVEDTLDLLALKDNASDVGDYAIGLHLIYEAKACYFLLQFSGNTDPM
jgi:hypothetical protein